MELASILSGGRFTDRPSSVCPIIGAVVRAYNDAVDDRRRQDLYRFAADAVGTRGDFALQRARAEVAITYVRDRRPKCKRPDPQLDAGPEEIADHVLVSMARRPRSRSPRRRWDDVTHAEMLELLERLIATGSGSNPLVGEFVEHPAEAVEHGGGDEQLLIAELGQGSPEAWLDLRAAGLDEVAPPFGEGGQDDAPVLVGARALHEAGLGETVEHLGDAGWTEIGSYRELAGGSVLAFAQAEEQAVLGV